MAKEVIVSYPHGYVARYTLTDLYCMKCGSKSVWRDKEDGRYGSDEGPEHLCAVCESTWSSLGLDEQLSSGSRDVLNAIAGLSEPPKE